MQEQAILVELPPQTPRCPHLTEGLLPLRTPTWGGLGAGAPRGVWGAAAPPVIIYACQLFFGPFPDPWRSEPLD